jgi:hypothetical protein
MNISTLCATIQIFSGQAVSWTDFGTGFAAKDVVACLRHAGSSWQGPPHPDPPPPGGRESWHERKISANQVSSARVSKGAAGPQCCPREFVPRIDVWK